VAFLLRVLDGREIPASKVFGIGRNYAEHAREMNYDRPTEPVVFQKPTTSLLHDGGAIELLPGLGLVHHELELAVVLEKGGRDIPAGAALDHVLGYAVCIDVTARDLQARAKKEGTPWLVSKGMDTFGPIGTVVPKDRAPALESIEIRLDVNGKTRQVGRLRDLLFPVPDLVAWISRRITLEPGDVLMTGTPEGVGPLVAGDGLVATGTGLPPLRVSVVRRE